MRVLGIHWIGVGTTRLKEMARFCQETLGLSEIKRGRGGAFVEFELESTQRFEVFGPRSASFERHKRPVIAFSVDDIAAARSELKAAGTEILTRTKSAGDASWFYFKGPDGNTYEIQQWHVGPYSRNNNAGPPA